MASFLAVLRLLGFIIITTDLNQVYANYCDFLEPKDSGEITRNADLFCEIKDQYISDWCLDQIKPYFEQVGENENSIKEYVKLCEKLNTTKCVLMIMKLKEFCYDMGRAVKLSKGVPNIYIHIFSDNYPGSPGKFDLYYSDWKEYGNMIDGIQIERCLGHTSEVIRQLHRYYKPWFNSEKGKADCDCNEIVGLKGFLTSGVNSGNLTLESVYKEFCLIDNKNDKKRKHVWSIRQLKSITEEKNLDYETKKHFIKFATKIGEAGWQENDKKECSFDVIYRFISTTELKLDYSYEKNVNFISSVIKAEIPCQTFFHYLEEFKKLTFLSVQCMTDIFNGIFTSDSNKKKFLEKCKTENFFTIIENFMIIYNRKFPKVDCSKLLQGIIQFQEIWGTLGYTEQRVVQSITKAEKLGTDYNDLNVFIAHDKY